MQGAFDLHLQIESNLPEMVGAFYSILSAHQQDVQDFVHIAVHLVQDVVRTAGGGPKKSRSTQGRLASELTGWFGSQSHYISLLVWWLGKNHHKRMPISSGLWLTDAQMMDWDAFQ